MQEVESSWTYVYVVGVGYARIASAGSWREPGSGRRSARVRGARVDRDLERDRGEEVVLLHTSIPYMVPPSS